MLSFVPVTLDLYRTVRRHLHWTLQNLVSFADRTGKCFPSVRTLAAATGQPRSTVSRHLAQLAEAGVIARQRRPGGVYAYVIAGRFLPAARGVSHQRERGVPPPGTEEQAGKKTGYARARFAKSGISFGEIQDDRSKWEARLRSWRKSGFWLPPSVRSRRGRMLRAGSIAHRNLIGRISRPAVLKLKWRRWSHLALTMSPRVASDDGVRVAAAGLSSCLRSA